MLIRYERLSGYTIELQASEAGIETALCGQAAMVALFDDPAMIHDDDPVGGADRSKAVGNDDRCAISHQPVERFLDQAFAFSVQRRGGLVEEKQRCVAAEQGASDGDPLALAA
jgi:hypothetical protein